MNFGYYPQGVIPNNQPIPRTTNWLDQETLNTLQKGLNQFRLSVTPEEIACGQCNHYNLNTGAPALISDNDDINGYTCSLCGEHFHMQEFSNEDVENTVNNILDILNVIKIMYLSIDKNAALEFFQVIPFIKKIPQLYKIAVDDFKKYESINNFTPTAQQSPFNLFSMIVNPTGFYPQQQPQQGYYQPPQAQVMPQQMGGMGQQMGFYPQQQPAYNPMYGAPMAPQPNMGYQPQQQGFNLNPQGAAMQGGPQVGMQQTPMVNTNMPVQQPAPAADDKVNVNAEFKK